MKVKKPIIKSNKDQKLKEQQRKVLNNIFESWSKIYKNQIK